MSLINYSFQNTVGTYHKYVICSGKYLFPDYNVVYKNMNTQEAMRLYLIDRDPKIHLKSRSTKILLKWIDLCVDICICMLLYMQYTCTEVIYLYTCIYVNVHICMFTNLCVHFKSFFDLSPDFWNQLWT